VRAGAFNQIAFSADTTATVRAISRFANSDLQSQLLIHHDRAAQPSSDKFPCSSWKAFEVLQ